MLECLYHTHLFRGRPCCLGNGNRDWDDGKDGDEDEDGDGNGNGDEGWDMRDGDAEKLDVGCVRFVTIRVVVQGEQSGGSCVQADNRYPLQMMVLR